MLNQDIFRKGALGLLALMTPILLEKYVSTELAWVAFFIGVIIFGLSFEFIRQFAIAHKRISIFVGLLAVAALGWALYSLGTQYKNPPVSSLRVVGESALPFVAGEMPKLFISLTNQEAYTIHARHLTVIAITGPIPNNWEVAKDGENKIWDVLMDKYRTKDKSSFILFECPPGGTGFTAEGSPKDALVGSVGDAVLTQEQAKALQTNSGAAGVFFMSIFSYADNTGVHEVHHCVETTGKGVARCASGHNGPVAPTRLDF